MDDFGLDNMLTSCVNFYYRNRVKGDIGGYDYYYRRVYDKNMVLVRDKVGHEDVNCRVLVEVMTTIGRCLDI